MYRTLFLALLCVFVASQAKAQPPSFVQTFQAGLMGEYSSNIYGADFMNLPGCSTCTHTNFTKGHGDGFLAGAFVRFPLGPLVGLDVAFGYTDQSGSLSADDVRLTPVTHNGEVKIQPLVFRQTIDATVHSICIEPQAYYYFYDAFRFSAGVGISAVIKGACTQTETIVDTTSDYIFYTAGGKTRTVFSGDIPGMRKILVSLSVGMGYDFTFGFIHPLIITPEVFYSLGMNDVVKGVNWQINTLRAGLRVSVPVGI
jgi:hypothetical protein